MTEIIIDGCNVVECDCYDNTYCLWSKKYHEIRITPKCEIVKDCYFKQLQRAKAEREQLRADYYFCNEQLKDYEAHYNRLLADMDELEAENERLKKALEEVRDIAVKKNYLSLDEALDDITNKINEVLQ